MKRTIPAFILCLFFLPAYSQPINARLALAFKQFESDAQMANGIASIFVMDAATGKTVYEKNATIGLAPASTQKIITAATAYEVLGNTFRYVTEFGYTGTLQGTVLNGDLFIRGAGDPTLGSWRWKTTGEEQVISRVMNAFRNTGIRRFGSIMTDENGWEEETIPDGWIWQDIGNYYGAGAAKLNWRENQYDLFLRSGFDLGGPVTITGTKPRLYGYRLSSEVKAAAKGTGDRTYIYLPVNDSIAMVRGTIPVNETSFTVSGSLPSGRQQLLGTLLDSLHRSGIQSSISLLPRPGTAKSSGQLRETLLHRESSPPLDSIVYWFLRKSVNLYGEALLKTIAARDTIMSTEPSISLTSLGVKRMVSFWTSKGIPETELNMADGSGLSPLNRVTTRAQVQVLAYARRQPWFPGYYLSFPEYNGMKMKSGTISDVKGFCGYHRSAAGKEYIYAFLVNNYNGSSTGIVNKMYKVLDVLK